jgi:alpha/beta superfamily hydrolase
MGMERLTFTGHSGVELAARLDKPAGPHLATALFAHCFTCSKDIAAAKRISARLAGMGIAVLRFDFTGLGHSGGEFENTTFSSNVDDLVLAAEHLASIGHAPSLLIGHSLGGAAILKAAGRIETAKAVVTIGAPFDPGHVTHNFAGALDEIKNNGVGEVTLGGRAIRIGKDFIDDVAAENLSQDIAKLKKRRGSSGLASRRCGIRR